jgi:hypothetical protein
MAKTKVDKKMNRIVKSINKDLEQDVFKNRFWIRQVKKDRDEVGSQYYLYEMKDRLEPERDSYMSWLWGGSTFVKADFFEAINDFIIKSDFWSIYWKDESRYNRKLDWYRNKNI